ncbi:hypothetical protein [Izhakiella capsodis]|uniref:hypothetical protein n=1 Tax=Izhakiella capsodis TaxID=1367852 RepID=UPI000B81D637|nr:hypothetical protein [Izhakiella capsodis]
MMRLPHNAATTMACMRLYGAPLRSVRGISTGDMMAIPKVSFEVHLAANAGLSAPPRDIV